MTDPQHPITPPPELVQQWEEQFLERPTINGCFIQSYIAAKAARWGADQQLEATDTWIRTEMKDRQRPANRIADDHRADMRPKPPSLKEQALALIDDCTDPEGDYLDDNALSIIRRALEALDD